MNSITIGLDIAKTVFQVHAEDGSGKVILRKRLRRAQVEGFFANHPGCVVGIEGLRLGALLGPNLAGAGP
jgi:transposase